jgi:hypothetical protein
MEIDGLEVKILKGMSGHLFFLQSQFNHYVLELERGE